MSEKEKKKIILNIKKENPDLNEKKLKKIFLVDYKDKLENFVNEFKNHQKTFFVKTSDFLEKSNKIEQKNLELVIHNQEISQNLQEIKKKRDLLLEEKNKEYNVLLKNKIFLKEKLKNENKLFNSLKKKNVLNNKKNINIKKFENISKTIIDLYLFFKKNIKKNSAPILHEKFQNSDKSNILKILTEIEKLLFSFTNEIKTINPKFIVKVKNKLELNRRKILIDKNLKNFENKKLEIIKKAKMRNIFRKRKYGRKDMFRAKNVQNNLLLNKSDSDNKEDSDKRFFE